MGLSVSGDVFYNRSCDEAYGFLMMLVLQAPSCAAYCVPVHVLRLLVGAKGVKSC